MNLAIDTLSSERYGLVTGSRCSSLVPKKDAQVGMITLAKQLAKEKYFRYWDEVSSWQMEHGNNAEVFAFEHFETYHDKDVKKGEFGFKGDIGWSPDAVCADYGVDFKAPTTLENFLDYLTDGISTYEYNQCQHYMMGLKLDRWLIAAFLIETQRMTDNGLTYPIAHPDRMILVEVKKSDEWQEKFHSNLPFVVGKREEYIEMYKLKFKTGSTTN